MNSYLRSGSTSDVFEVVLNRKPAVMKQSSLPSLEARTAQVVERFGNETRLLPGPLRHLQGTVAPRVYVAGSLPGADLPRMVVELDGSTSLSHGEIEEAKSHLACIHAAVVLHGDVRGSMLYRTKPSGGSPSSIRTGDFSHGLSGIPLGWAQLEEQAAFSQLLSSMAGSRLSSTEASAAGAEQAQVAAEPGDVQCPPQADASARQDRLGLRHRTVAPGDHHAARLKLGCLPKQSKARKPAAAQLPAMGQDTQHSTAAGALYADLASCGISCRPTASAPAKRCEPCAIAPSQVRQGELHFVKKLEKMRAPSSCMQVR